MDIKPNLQVMLLVFIVFLITMYFLNAFVFKPLLNFMQARDDKIKKDLDDAKKDDTELLAIEEEIKQCIEEAKIQAHKIIEAEIKQAKEAASTSLQKVRLENKTKLESYILAINENQSALKAELKSYLGDLESTLSSKIKNA